MSKSSNMLRTTAKNILLATGVVVAAAGGVSSVVMIAYGTATLTNQQHAVTETVTPASDENVYVLPDNVSFFAVPNNMRFLTACATEDSDNCYWDAATHGNGTGTSFISLDGVLYFAEMP